MSMSRRRSSWSSQRLMHALYMALANHKHPHTNTHLLAVHTYNILPCFECICGPAQRPLHELFVINERARGLLLQWSSERTSQKTTCKKFLYCMRGLNLTPKTRRNTSLSAHTKHRYEYIYIYSCCGWIRPAMHKQPIYIPSQRKRRWFQRCCNLNVLKAPHLNLA